VSPTTRSRRRTRGEPAQHAERLLRILTANLERTRDPALRERLHAAIEALPRKQEAA
jgi:DNA-binding MurR/RpiR family transcriptional regulator